jgi:8-oxo-dGTP diphosphatase
MRVALIITRGNKVLLMHRFKDGREYYVFPGGGMKDKEKPAEAAKREAKEELNLDVVLGKKIFENINRGESEVYFGVKKISKHRIKITGEELERQSKNNVYHPEWVDFKNLSQINLLPKNAKNKLLSFIAKIKK